MDNMSKQDRQGARTPSDIERKYNFGKTFAEVMGIATDAQQAADKAASGVDGLDNKLNQAEIFNRLTNNGQLQGIYRGADGEIYINATYIKSGELNAELIKSGTMKCSVNTQTESDSTSGNYMVQSSVLPSGLFAYSKDAGMSASLTFEDLILQGPNSEIYIAPKGGYHHETAIKVMDDVGSFWVVIEPSNGVGCYLENALGGRAFITGLTAPVNDTDAVNKAYVDALEKRVAALEAAIKS